MAKNSITDYSKTASLNTDIQSVDIDEGCLPSGINNAIRELMADLAAVNDGTVALTSPAFTSVDINSGTIDGVTIGGSSAAAGTFTTFTSTGIDDNASSTAVAINSSNNVGIGTSLPQTLLEIASGNSGNDAALDSPTFRINNTTESADWDIGDAIGTIEYYSSDSSGNSPYVTSFIKSVNDTGDGTLPSGALTFGTATYNEVGGAVERLRIDSSGNVGVGISNPSSYGPFVVSGTGAVGNFNASSGAALVQLYENGAGRFGIQTLNGSAGAKFTVAGSEKIRIDSSGNVGIGTSSPASFGATANGLTINGTTNSNIIWQEGGSNKAFAYTNANDFIIGSEQSGGNTIFTAAGSERMRIDSSGRVGIGTSSPDTKFHVEESGAADLYATFENSNAGGYGAFVDIKSTANFSFSRFTGGTKSWIIGQRGLAGGAFSIYDQDNSAHRMVFNSSGKVGIGTSSPSSLLTVSSGSSSAAVHSYTKLEIESSSHSALQFSGSTGAEQWIWFADDSSSTPVGGLTYYHGGEYMAMRVAGAERFRVSKIGALNGIITNVGTYTNGTASSANMVVASGGQFLRSVSAGKYKTDVEDMEASYAEALYGLRSVYYRSNLAVDNPDHSHWGFIAEEVAAIDPRLVHYKTVEVTYDDNGAAVETELDTPVAEGVQYERFVPLLLKLIKDQKDRIEALETQNADFEARLTTLEGN